MIPIGEDGYELWLRYRPMADAERLAQYRAALSSVVVLGAGATVAIIKKELERALPALLGCDVPFEEKPVGSTLVAGTVEEVKRGGGGEGDRDLGDEGFLIRSLRRYRNRAFRRFGGQSEQPAKASIPVCADVFAGAHPVAQDGELAMTPHDSILVTAHTAPAVLTGIFHFLRLLQTGQDIRDLDLVSRPRIRRRILAHWDNLDGSIERGYAGRSLWQWDELPETLDPRYHDYARACASVGINGACLTNVNAGARSLTAEYLTKTAALADLFRPYGVRVYLSPDFAAPIRIGGLATSDPRDRAVAAWWRRKADEIYRLIPDFGGFQVKANSEGRAGPQDYGATHADGANMLADALAPHGGVLLWRAFVYDMTVDADRAKCAYKEFTPLDGRFHPNVFVQVKNGPIDFQPREPFHPLFGAMRKTPLALELQITQEYLGQSTYLTCLGPMWEEVLGANTYATVDASLRGAPFATKQSLASDEIASQKPLAMTPRATVAHVVDGSLYGHADSCIIGVANTGSDRNWCGHHFAQANWYAFGRLAWDHILTAEAIADEWARMTWSNDPPVVEVIRGMMLCSWEACINTMTPLGLHHLMQEGHHYGPDPGFDGARRPDWNNVYFHRADKSGLGFDRSSTGSNAIGQYNSPLREQLDDLDTCPEELLLWFHHVPWDHRLRSGRTLWEELRCRYDAGVAAVEQMGEVWQGLQAEIDPQRHEHVGRRLAQQLENARLWRDVCVAYFGQFAHGER
jgi:alpha-glucuronidase